MDSFRYLDTSAPYNRIQLYTFAREYTIYGKITVGAFMTPL
jgi:hypothetical protein